MEPKISIVLPVQSHHGSIISALDTVLEQTFSDVEIIVIDGSGSPECQEVLYCYQDKITYVQANTRHLSELCNIGLYMASAEYIIFHQCEQFWHPGKLACQYKAMSSNPLLVACVGKIAAGKDKFTEFNLADSDYQLATFSSVGEYAPLPLAITLFKTNVVKQSAGLVGNNWQSAKARLYFHCLSYGRIAGLPMMTTEGANDARTDGDVDDLALLQLVNECLNLVQNQMKKIQLSQYKRQICMVLSRQSTTSGEYKQAAEYLLRAAKNSLLAVYYQCKLRYRVG
ncbi:glycosyltransferase family 2 protein [Thalassotalea mangrovi]|uniref:Glycosyltransferase family 2 protein n=1 Tax=Thalassotalea mangrovi TaxID=2572245 RepID=A0A4U1B5G9_9GAMM|nr:glycosyltransferase family A protein [Thalassotalea mangrovi]TKB45648.1 glycosyltransferase family 2 protein [Thalassotalea mangrovi]